jgi:hypothetical protein
MRSRIIIVLASVVGAISLFVSPALASSGVPIPGTVTANANATLTDLALKRVNQSGSLVVYDEHIKVAKRKSGCKWYRHFTNSSYVVGSYHGSHIVGYPDANGYLCRNSHSPTGFVKRGGGATRRDCRNIAAPPNKAVPFPVFRGKLVSFASRSEAKIKVHAKAAIHSVLDLWCGHFEGSAVAEDNIWVRLTTYVKLKSRNSKMKFFAKFFVKAADKVSQNVSLSCSFTPLPPAPPPPPPKPTPTPTPSPTPTPTPPPKVKVKLVKFCFVDGDKVECPKDFGFSVNGNGGFTNSGGEVTSLVEVNSGTQVTVCETDPKGWTRDGDQCQTLTATGSYATVTFKNKKVTPPPPKAHAKLVKKAYVDGNSKTLTGGEFSFSVSVNGSVKFSTTNAASGSSRDLGDFNAGDVVKVCETDSDGFTPDDECITHTMVAGETFTYSFVNRKTTPKVPQPHAIASAPCPSSGSVRMVTVTLTNTGNADAVNVAVEVTGASNSPASFTVHPGQTLTPTFSTSTDIDVRVRAMFGSDTLFDQTFPKCAVPKAHAKLVKKAYVDGNSKTLTGGEFSFSVSVNGSVKFSTTNAASGSSRDLGDFNAGDVVKVCETDSDGFTPDDECITHTMVAGETFTYSFVNRKTTPPTPPTVTNVTQPQEVYVNETYPNFCADVTSPAGHTVKVVFGARFGVGFTKTITSTGSDRVCGTYTAPTDLPFVWTPPSWSGFSNADTWEQVHVVATDLDTDLSSTSSKNPPEDVESYVWFPILRPPANP